MTDTQQGERETSMAPRAARDARRADAAIRRRDALQLRRSGATYEQIAHELDCSKSSAHKMVHEAIADIPREEATAVLAIELERLDRGVRRIEQAQDRIEPDVRAGNHKAILLMIRLEEALRSNQERRANYLGLDAPKKAAVAIGCETHGLGDWLASAFDGPAGGRATTIDVGDELLLGPPCEAIP